MTSDAWVDTVRLARDLGDMSLLLPPGITHLMDLPHTMFQAVRNALAFLGFEKLPSDEQPPRDIWMDGKRMKQHIEGVEAARAVKFGGKANKMSDEPIDGPTERNALVDELLV